MGLMKSYYRQLPKSYMHLKVGIHLAEMIGKHFDSVGINYKMNVDGEVRNAYENLIETIAANNFLMSKKFKNRWLTFHVRY